MSFKIEGSVEKDIELTGEETKEELEQKEEVQEVKEQQEKNIYENFIDYATQGFGTMGFSHDNLGVFTNSSSIKEVNEEIGSKNNVLLEGEGFNIKTELDTEIVEEISNYIMKKYEKDNSQTKIKEFKEEVDKLSPKARGIIEENRKTISKNLEFVDLMFSGVNNNQTAKEKIKNTDLEKDEDLLELYEEEIFNNKENIKNITIKYSLMARINNILKMLRKRDVTRNIKKDPMHYRVAMILNRNKKNKQEPDFYLVESGAQEFAFYGQVGVLTSEPYINEDNEIKFIDFLEEGDIENRTKEIELSDEKGKKQVLEFPTFEDMLENKKVKRILNNLGQDVEVLREKIKEIQYIRNNVQTQKRERVITQAPTQNPPR